jgi:hypothetical protein
MALSALNSAARACTRVQVGRKGRRKRGRAPDAHTHSQHSQGAVVTHQYRLHEDLLAECLCCHAQQPFHFESSSQQVVCTFCTRHIGTEKAERRDADHVRLWSEMYTDALETHQRFVAESERVMAEKDAAIRELEERVTELTSLVAGQFDQTQTGGVRSVLQTELLKRAERRTELESRRTARAMRVLAQLAVLHRSSEDDPLRCACGRSVVECAERAAIEPLGRDIAEWDSRSRRIGAQ